MTKEAKISHSLDDVAAFLRHHGMRLEVRTKRDLYLVMLSKSADAKGLNRKEDG